MHAKFLAVLLGSAQLAQAAATPKAPVRRDGVSPALPHDDKTTEFCTWWHDYLEATSCEDVLVGNSITSAQLKRWNPSLGDNCKGMTVGKSYCVEAMFEPEPVEPEEPEPSKPSPTKPSNGIETPASIQPGMVSNCNKFHLVKADASCTAIAAQYGITLTQFTTWNSGIGSACNSMWANAYACVSIIGFEPGTPTEPAPGNGIETPSPIQPNMVKDCNKFALVGSTTTCASLQDYYKITMAEIFKWNPAVGSGCSGLWAQYYVCVSVVGWKPPTNVPAPSPTKPANGISTPSPIREPIHANCNKFALVGSTTTCASLQDYYKISMAQIAAWNTPVGTDCKGLWAGYNVCVGIVGQQTPTNPPSSGSTPSPVQSGMVKNCKKFHLVNKSTTCAALQSTYKVTMAQLYKWNPAIGSGCNALWAEYYVCVSA
ncbi:hypothetical protein FPOA_06507 [Fusarium poae]|uniref:LysM domain-containing protein n=1 Tax=Fusarium poae TaxID=36050 RepID=A0A1B8AZR8_FUSPO|nr:hypothetical protein FPOA_06507 [Fusarium poae]